jgi:virginiamycin A acetyltransferase
MKAGLLAIANRIGLLLALPWVIWSKIGLLFGSERAYRGSAYFLSIFPGSLGFVMRRAFYKYLLISSHWDLLIAFGSVVTHPTTSLGRQIYIGSYSLIGRCKIGDDVIIGSRVSIPSGRHQHRFNESTSISQQGGVFEEIEIGSDVWIGEGAIVMANVGPKAVVGAGAVVVKPVLPGLVVVGNPARESGRRGEIKSSNQEPS